MTKLSTRDKVDMAIAWSGAVIVLTILITAGVLAYYAGPKDTSTTEDPEVRLRQV